MRSPRTSSDQPASTLLRKQRHDRESGVKSTLANTIRYDSDVLIHGTKRRVELAILSDGAASMTISSYARACSTPTGARFAWVWSRPKRAAGARRSDNESRR